MDKIIGKGRISANSVVVFTSAISKFLGRKKLHLSFMDSDAYPFARFLIMGKNQEIVSKFFLGAQGTTHGGLFQRANVENQEILGPDWVRNPNYKHLSRILSAGRIWTEKKIIVMRDARPEPCIVAWAANQLNRYGVTDIESYQLLYEDSTGNIHSCQIHDYLNGSADNYGYLTHEEMPSSAESATNSKTYLDRSPMSQAEYNYYRRYGLGDDIMPRKANLREGEHGNDDKSVTTPSWINRIIRRCVAQVLRNHGLS